MWIWANESNAMTLSRNNIYDFVFIIVVVHYVAYLERPVAWTGVSSLINTLTSSGSLSVLIIVLISSSLFCCIAFFIFNAVIRLLLFNQMRIFFASFGGVFSITCFTNGAILSRGADRKAFKIALDTASSASTFLFHRHGLIIEIEWGNPSRHLAL